MLGALGIPASRRNARPLAISVGLLAFGSRTPWWHRCRWTAPWSVRVVHLKNVSCPAAVRGTIHQSCPWRAGIPGLLLILKNATPAVLFASRGFALEPWRAPRHA